MHIGNLISTILSIATVGLVWLVSSKLHSSNLFPDEMLKLPRTINFIFGGFNSDGLLNTRVMLGQIVFFITILIINLVNFGSITRTEAYNIIFWLTGAIALFAIISTIIRKNK